MSRRPSRPRFAPHPSLVGRKAVAKRAVDVTVAVVGLLLVSPVLLAIALLVGLTSRGPMLYRQRRLGLHGRVFDMVKFRTMVEDAEPDGRAVWAVTDDARCTLVGAFLRRFSLDEIPQLWNVLVGDMSLVGPRPERPEFAREFARRWPGYNDRLAVRCGITGLAQVEGWRGDSNIGERLECDLRYIAGWSFANDLSILLRTIPEVLLHRRTRLRQGAVRDKKRTVPEAIEIESGGI
jgi:lipopolysaccharide/colanic/teichoic acid biosynthesis glycosyltransferase